MLTCLFWNFNSQRRDQEEIVAQVAVGLQVDLLVLADTTIDPALLLSELRRSDTAYDQPRDQGPPFYLFTRFPGEQVTRFREDPTLSVRKLKLPGKREILFAVIHFFDRRNNNLDVQHSKARDVYLTLRAAERDAGHTRTLVVGDFNMNPYEKGMTDTKDGFGAMMTRDLASRHSSGTVDGDQRFYNPGWSRMGRPDPDAAGTYYWEGGADPFNVYWHSLDTVLVRPDLLDGFDDAGFQILTKIPGAGGETCDLVRSTGKHWGILISDHLPILFKFEPPSEDDNHARDD